MKQESASNQSQPTGESLLSSEQVAAKLNISSRCVLNWLYAGIIPAAVRVGKVIRFREDDVMAALEKASDPSEEAKNVEDLVRWALWLVAPDVAEEPSWLLMRDPTDSELKQTAELAAFFFQKLQEVGTRQERKAFCQGVVDAAFLHRHRD